MITRTFLEVLVHFDLEGKAKPLTLIYNDRRFEIDRVVDFRRCGLKDTDGIYIIMIKGQHRELHRAGDKWFVESGERQPEIIMPYSF